MTPVAVAGKNATADDRGGGCAVGGGMSSIRSRANRDGSGEGRAADAIAAALVGAVGVVGAVFKVVGWQGCISYKDA